MSLRTLDDTATADEPDGAVAAELRDLHIGFGAGDDRFDVVRGVSLRLRRGQVLALVGESGSGKSLTSLALMGLLPRGAAVTSGQVRVGGVDPSAFGPKQWQALRGRRVAMIFQDPMAALNPSFTVGWQVAEPFRRHLGDNRRTARGKAIALMEQVGIPDAEAKYGAYPHEFSGGMRQRAVIAMALALQPDVVLADEPTTALDVTVQAQILRLLAERQHEAGLAMLLVSHDLGVVAKVAREVAVMYAGRIVEQGPIGTLYDRPAHPYTLGLMGAVPDSLRAGARLRSIAGLPPDPRQMPSGCSFHPRCDFATPVCAEQVPHLRGLGDEREVACHNAETVLAHEHEGTAR